jgi:glycolate oxidase FAD binding subunit
MADVVWMQVLPFRRQIETAGGNGQGAVGDDQCIIQPVLIEVVAVKRDQHDEFFLEAGKAQHAGAALWRLSVPSVASPLALEGDTLVDWGGAQRWLVCSAPAAAVRAAATAAGGHATLYRAQDKSAGVFTPLSAPLARIQRDLQAAFDPDGVFNRARLYPNS